MACHGVAMARLALIASLASWCPLPCSPSTESDAAPAALAAADSLMARAEEAILFAEAEALCACDPRSNCTYRNDVHFTEQPVDPLMWCAVPNPNCVYSTRGHHAAPFTPQELVGAIPHGVPTNEVHGWRHCRKDALFGFGDAARSERRRVHDQLAVERAKAGVAAKHPINVPVRHAVPREYRPHALLHGHAKLTPHFVFHSDCPSDGTGANSFYWWFMLAVATQTRMQLVWNEQHFVSENSPQYQFSKKYGCSHLDQPCVAPSDLFTPFGLYAGGHIVAPFGAAELFRRVERGELKMYYVDEELGLIAKHKNALLPFTRSITKRAAKWTHPHAVIIKRCAYVGMISPMPGLHGWVRYAYEMTRRVLRPMLPPPMHSLQHRKFTIVVAIRRGDTTPADWGFASNAWFTPMEWYTAILRNIFGAGVGLNCNTASVVVVAQSHARYVDEFDVISHAVGPKGKCWFPALSEPNDESPDASARSIFRDFDIFSAADIFVPSRNSAFSKIAMNFLHEEAIRFIAEAECVRDFNAFAHEHGANVIQADSRTGCFDKKAFKELWEHRDYDTYTAHLIELNAEEGGDNEKHTAEWRMCTSHADYSNIKHCADACATGREKLALTKMRNFQGGERCKVMESLKMELLGELAMMPIGAYWEKKKKLECATKYLTQQWSGVAVLLKCAAAKCGCEGVGAHAEYCWIEGKRGAHRWYPKKATIPTGWEIMHSRRKKHDRWPIMIIFTDNRVDVPRLVKGDSFTVDGHSYKVDSMDGILEGATQELVIRVQQFQKGRQVYPDAFSDHLICLNKEWLCRKEEVTVEFSESGFSDRFAFFVKPSGGGGGEYTQEEEAHSANATDYLAVATNIPRSEIPAGLKPGLILHVGFDEEKFVVVHVNPTFTSLPNSTNVSLVVTKRGGIKGDPRGKFDYAATCVPRG